MEAFEYIVFGLILTVNAVWYYVKVRLKKNGYSAGLFTRHLEDFKNLKYAQEKESNTGFKEEARHLYVALKVAIIACIIGIPVSFLVFK